VFSQLKFLWRALSHKDRRRISHRGARRPLPHPHPQRLELLYAYALGIRRGRLAREEAREFVVEFDQLARYLNAFGAV
jgi:hypothetical protein